MTLPPSPGSTHSEGRGYAYGADFGARVTLVDSQTGQAATNVFSPSVDYISEDIFSRGYIGGGGGIPSVTMDRLVVLGGLCKSDYVIGGASLNPYSGGYVPKHPPVPKDENGRTMYLGERDYPGRGDSVIPRTVSIGARGWDADEKAVKQYFTNDTVLDSFAQDIGADFATVTSGKYKLLVEPLVFLVLDSTMGFVGTPTEIALADIVDLHPSNDHVTTYDYFRRMFGWKYVLYNYPRSLVLEQPEFGVYPAGEPATDKEYTATSGSGWGYSEETVVARMGLLTVTFPPQGTPIYYHTYKVDVQLPDGKSLADIQNLPFAEQIALLKSGEAKALGSTWTPTITGMLTNAEPAVKDNKYYPTLDPKLAELTAANPKSSGITDANIYEYKKCVRGKPRTRAYVT